MAVFHSTTNLHMTSITSLSWVYFRIAVHSKRLHAAPYLCQEIWQCFSLQLTFTSLPSQVCLGFTFALLFTANAFTLCLFLRQEIWQCISLLLTFTSTPSQVCLELTFALLFTANAFTLRLIFVKRYGSVSLYNSPSHHHHKFVLGLPSHCSSQQTPSRCALFSSRDMAVILSTTYLHITFTSLSWVYLRIAFHSKHLHAAP